MLPLVTGLMSGAANLAGSYFSAQTSSANTEAQIAAQQQMLGQTEQFNAGQAQIQRDYETTMANTAYQRASKDMQAAGLNPAVMFGSGGAAATPSVGAASVGTPNVPSFQKTSALGQLGPAVAQAVNAAVSAKTIDKMGDEIARINAEKNVADAQVDLVKSTTGNVAQRNIISLPDETKAQLFNDWLRKHPELTTASQVAKEGGEAVEKVVKPIGDIFGTGGRFFGDLMEGFNSSAKGKMRNLYTLPEARQKMKDLENSFQSGTP